jgi:DNA polymerase-3 subunit epsilon
MKSCFIDVETTGLNPEQNGIIQISGQIFDDEQLMPVSDFFDFRVRTFPGDKVVDSALEANGVTLKEIQGYPMPRIVYGQLLALFGSVVKKFDRTDKMFFIAYNANFDYQFMRSWFSRAGDNFFGSWFWFPPLDVMTLAGIALRHRRPELSNFKQATVAAALGIEVDEARLHDARYDIELCMEIYKRSMPLVFGSED